MKSVKLIIRLFLLSAVFLVACGKDNHRDEVKESLSVLSEPSRMDEQVSFTPPVVTAGAENTNNESEKNN